jgi:hypothetical protein
VPTAFAVTAVLLVRDAWFDVTTTSGGGYRCQRGLRGGCRATPRRCHGVGGSSSPPTRTVGHPLPAAAHDGGCPMRRPLWSCLSGSRCWRRRLQSGTHGSRPVASAHRHHLKLLLLRVTGSGQDAHRFLHDPEPERAAGHQDHRARRIESQPAPGLFGVAGMEPADHRRRAYLHSCPGGGGRQGQRHRARVDEEVQVELRVYPERVRSKVRHPGADRHAEAAAAARPGPRYPAGRWTGSGPGPTPPPPGPAAAPPTPRRTAWMRRRTRGVATARRRRTRSATVSARHW